MVFYYLIFPLVFFTIALILAKRDFLLAVGFIFLLHVFLKIILFKTIPNISFASGTLINITIVFIFLYYSLTKPSILNTKTNILFFIYILFFFLYLTILAVYNNHDIFGYIYYVRNYFFNFLLFIIYLSVKPKKYINAKYFITVIVIVTFIQSALGILQFINPEIADFFTIREYSRNEQIIQRFGTTLAGQKLITGTFSQMQDVSSFIMVNIIFILALISFKIFKLDIRKLGLLIITVAAMIVIGVRAPFIGLLLGIGAILWFKNKRIFAIVSIGSLIFAPLYIKVIEPNIAFALSQAGIANFEDPISRLYGIFAVFKPEYLELTSISRTYYLSQFIFQNPVFGSGPGIIFTDYSFSDAFLTLWVVETGFLGLLFLLFPYLYILNQIRKSNYKVFFKTALIILLVALSQSITNEGLWTLFTNIQVIFMFMVLIRINNEVKIKMNLKNIPTS